MQIEYNSNWLDFTIELIKCFGDIKETIRNEEIGSIDYIIDDENKKKLIRAFVDKNYNAALAKTDTVRTTTRELDEKYQEAVIVSNRITDSAYDIVKQQENLEVITPKIGINYNVTELVSAVQKKTKILCKLKCGKAPETKDDCNGKQGKKYVCDIRRLSDDATFHARMKWKDVLLNDFYSLCKLERKITH